MEVKEAARAMSAVTSVLQQRAAASIRREDGISTRAVGTTCSKSAKRPSRLADMDPVLRRRAKLRGQGAKTRRGHGRWDLEDESELPAVPGIWKHL